MVLWCCGNFVMYFGCCDIVELWCDVVLVL